MDTNIKVNIAKNISELRKSRKMTQADLGKELAFSGKTVSKWESGMSVPDIDTLAQIAQLFNVTIDDLTKEDAVYKSTDTASTRQQQLSSKRIAVLCLTIASVFLAAALVYISTNIIFSWNFWQIFVWAVPVSAFFGLLSTPKKVRYNSDSYITFSTIICWGAITGFYIQLLQYNLWYIFLLGVPIQAIIVLRFILKKYKNNTRK